jgi:hypothetical protein
MPKAKKKTEVEIIRERSEQVTKEIKEHKKWCHDECRTFLPKRYRKYRMKERMSMSELMRDPYLYHKV